MVDNPVNSIVKMMAVLNCFSAVQGRLSVAELASRTKLPRPTVHRIVSTMVDLGILAQERRRDQYTLGAALLGLGTTMLANLELGRDAERHVEALRAATGQTIHLAVFDGTYSTVVSRGEPDGSTAISTFVLKTSLAHACSTGKIALAFQPAQTIERYIGLGLRKVAPGTISDPERFREELRISRARGYAIDEEESGPGARCVGAPIHNASGRVFAAISISGRKSEIDDEKLESYAALVTHYAGAISLDLGFDPAAAPTPS